MKRYTLAVLSLFFSLTAVTNDANATVVSSLKPLAFIAAAITDGVTTDEVLLPDGASPHTYALRPSDIRKLQNAELVVWIGEEMEMFLTRPIDKLESNNVLTLTNVPAIRSLLLPNNGHHGDHDDHHHHHSDNDLHIWLSPKIAEQIAQAIHDKLVEIHPQQREQLQNNLQRFITALQQSDNEQKLQFNQVKEQSYLVFHDAYHYFENYFGLTQGGYLTINPDVPVGAKRLAQIRQDLVTKQIHCVFIEPQFQPTIINTLTQGLAIKQTTIDPLGTDIKVSKESYIMFLAQLSSQFLSCLNNKN